MKTLQALAADGTNDTLYWVQRAKTQIDELAFLELNLFYAENFGYASEVMEGGVPVSAVLCCGCCCCRAMNLTVACAACVRVWVVQLQLALYDGCMGSTNPVECNNIKNGLFKKGLHAAVQYMIQLLRDIMLALEQTSLQAASLQVWALSYHLLY